MTFFPLSLSYTLETVINREHDLLSPLHPSFSLYYYFSCLLFLSCTRHLVVWRISLGSSISVAWDICILLSL
jgi:hypothetical protein